MRTLFSTAFGQIGELKAEMKAELTQLKHENVLAHKDTKRELQSITGGEDRADERELQLPVDTDAEFDALNERSTRSEVVSSYKVLLSISN